MKVSMVEVFQYICYVNWLPSIIRPEMYKDGSDYNNNDNDNNKTTQLDEYILPFSQISQKPNYLFSTGES